MFYVGLLAAPLFLVVTLFASAAGGIEDAVNLIQIPSLSDVVDLGVFNFLSDALDKVVDFLTDVLRGLLYMLLIILFDQFVNGIKGQFLGSFTSICFLVSGTIIYSNLKG